jgi:hypothetical protein
VFILFGRHNSCLVDTTVNFSCLLHPLLGSCYPLLHLNVAVVTALNVICSLRLSSGVTSSHAHSSRPRWPSRPCLTRGFARRVQLVLLTSDLVRCSPAGGPLPLAHCLTLGSISSAGVTVVVLFSRRRGSARDSYIAWGIALGCARRFCFGSHASHPLLRSNDDSAIQIVPFLVVFFVLPAWLHTPLLQLLPCGVHLLFLYHTLRGIFSWYHSCCRSLLIDTLLFCFLLASALLRSKPFGFFFGYLFLRFIPGFLLPISLLMSSLIPSPQTLVSH